MKLVLDTSILIDHLRGGDKWQQILSKLDKNTEVFIPTIVFFELYSGKSSADVGTSRKIRNLVKHFQRIELSENISEKAGQIYRDITSDLEVPDYIVAASALDIGGTVITLNDKHFHKIPGLLIYS